MTSKNDGRYKMEQYLYSILDEYGNVTAKDMTLDVAMVLLRALFMEYFNEPTIGYQMVRQEK
jgi:hypothetical protein